MKIPPLGKSVYFLPFIIIFLLQFSFAKGDMPDTLIRVTQLNEKTIHITFSPDAVTAFNTSKGIVVIDAAICTQLTSQYRAIIEKEFIDNIIGGHGQIMNWDDLEAFKRRLAKF